MNSKFLHISLITLLAMISPLETVCSQTNSSGGSPNYGLIQGGMLTPPPARNLPPIVSGTQNRAPSELGTTQALPPIVSGQQQRQQIPDRVGSQQRALPPIVSAGTELQSNADFQIGSTASGAAKFQPRQANPLKPIQAAQASQGPKQSESKLSPPSSLPQAASRLQPGQGLSSSGVPYYSTKHNPATPFTVEQPVLNDNAGQAPQVLENSTPGTLRPTTNPQIPRTVRSTPAQPVSSMRQESVPQDPAPREGMASVMSPPDSSPPDSPQNMLPGESEIQGRTVPQATFSPNESAAWGANPDYFEMGQIQPEFTPGCQDCLNAGGLANCPTCASASSGDFGQGGSGTGQGGSGTGYFGAISSARRYAELDLLYMNRTDGSIVLSNFGGLGNFDWNAGWRATLGQRDDETQGKELSYFGTTDVSQAINRTDAGFRLSALFSPVGVIDPSLTNPFFNANIQNERMQTELHSFELNRVRWAWDVVKSFIGIRYIHVDDSYQMFSQRGVNNADYELKSLNNLIGVHIGREAFYDIGYRISFSALGKAGIYANANRFEVNVANNGVPFVANRSDSSTFSTSLELMLTGHYQINRRARLRMGYQALLLDDVYSVSDNLTGNLSPFFGSREPDKDSMFFHGLNIGLEFYR